MHDMVVGRSKFDPETIVDSGASEHVVNDIRFFHIFERWKRLRFKLLTVHHVD